MTAAHVTSAADRPWTCHHAPFAREPHTCRRGQAQPQRPHLQHVYHRVPRELDIEFEPSRRWTRQFQRSLHLSWKLAATCTRHRPSEADIARERKLLQLRVIYLCDRFKISQDRIWNLDETAVCAWSQQASAGGPKKPSASRAFVTVTLAANMRGGTWTQIVCEEKSDRVHPHGPAFPCQLPETRGRLADTS